MAAQQSPQRFTAGTGSLAGLFLRNPLFLLSPSAAFLLCLLAAYLIVFRYSFNIWHPVTRMQPGWTLANYLAFLGDVYYLGVLGNTLRIALLVTVVCLLLGYPVAYFMSISRYRHLLLFAVVSPLLIDPLVRAYGWIVLLSPRGMVNSFLIGLHLWNEPRQLLFTEVSVIAALIHEHLAFTVLPLAAVLNKIDPRLREAAVGLGASKFVAFARVTLPLSLPGILAGTLLTFATTVSAFVAPLVLGGGKVQMMSLIIRQQMVLLLNWPLGSAEAILLVMLVVMLLYFYNLALRRARVRVAPTHDLQS